jgi:hypothetical protein
MTVPFYNWQIWNDMVVVCQSDNTFYLKNKNWFSGGLVVFELKHALETTISGSCSVTTNRGIYIPYIYTHDLPHSRRAHEPIHHRRGLYDMKLILINVKYVSFRFPVSVFIYIYIRYIYTLICTKTKLVCVASPLSAHHTSLRRKSKDWLARNHDNVT